jgi:hypothetical protein
VLMSFACPASISLHFFLSRSLTLIDLILLLLLLSLLLLLLSFSTLYSLLSTVCFY